MLLKIDDLKVHFKTDFGTVKAVDGVSFELKKGEVLGIVGESGSGKSMISFSIMNMVPKNGKVVDGNILFDSKHGKVDIAKLGAKSKEMRSLRGDGMSMIFQEPMASLNPVKSIKKQFFESLMQQNGMTKDKAQQLSVDMLEAVGIVPAERRLKQFPHELSGGMRQRVMIGLALCRNPNLLIADEPTTALDVTIEAQILDLIKKMQKKLNISVIFITHDLGVIGEIADRVIIVYMGKIVEQGTCDEIFNNPRHPYTKALLKSIPEIGHKGRLYSIKGTVPSPFDLPEGCSFEPRCEEATEKCKSTEPPEVQLFEGHKIKCWLYCKKEKTNAE